MESEIARVCLCKNMSIESYALLCLEKRLLQHNFIVARWRVTTKAFKHYVEYSSVVHWSKNKYENDKLRLLIDYSYLRLINRERKKTYQKQQGRHFL